MTKLNQADYNKYQKITKMMTAEEMKNFKTNKMFPTRLIDTANKENLVIENIYKYARLMIV